MICLLFFGCKGSTNRMKYKTIIVIFLDCESFFYGKNRNIRDILEFLQVFPKDNEQTSLFQRVRLIFLGFEEERPAVEVVSCK